MQSFLNCILILTGMSFVTSANASGNLQCGIDIQPSGMPFSYCITPGSSSRVIVYFPGVGNFANNWNDGVMAQNLASSLAKLGVYPTILTMGVGPIQFLSGDVRSSGYTDIEEVSQSMVRILKEYGIRNLESHPGTVELYGESMGGFNSLQVFARHPEYFNRLALICPAESRISPFAPITDWAADMLTESGVHPVLSVAFREALTFAFRSEDQWQAESPLTFISSRYRAMSVRQPIYIATVQNDKFGFGLVEDSLTSALQHHGHHVARNETSNTQHCFVNPAPLAAFLAK